MLTLKKEKLLCENVARNEKGELTFAGASLSYLKEKYGTPLYLYDEDRIRMRCREYITAVRDVLGEGGQVLYASKAASFKRLYEIIGEEGLGIDVVSSGEIYTASRAGFPLSRAYFHSNNKTDEDIDYAMEMGVGYFVVDNIEELCVIEKLAAIHGINPIFL